MKVIVILIVVGALRMVLKDIEKKQGELEKNWDHLEHRYLEECWRSGKTCWHSSAVRSIIILTVKKSPCIPTCNFHMNSVGESFWMVCYFWSLFFSNCSENCYHTELTHQPWLLIRIFWDNAFIWEIFSNPFSHVSKCYIVNWRDLFLICKVSKFGDLSQGWPEGSLFNSYYTEL